LRQFVISKNSYKVLYDLLPKNGDGVKLENINLEDFIFASRKGGKLSIQRLHQLINYWAKKAGIKGHFGSHTLRKTFAYFLLKKGADIHLLMKTLNHSSPSVTLRYAGVEQEDIDNAMLRLNL
jgi:site-specific recombinase XerD